MIGLILRGVRLIAIGLVIYAFVIWFGDTEVPWWAGVISFVLGSLLGAWSHNILTSVQRRPITKEEAQRWMRGEK